VGRQLRRAAKRLRRAAFALVGVQPAAEERYAVGVEGEADVAGRTDLEPAERQPRPGWHEPGIGAALGPAVALAPHVDEPRAGTRLDPQDAVPPGEGGAHPTPDGVGISTGTPRTDSTCRASAVTPVTRSSRISRCMPWRS